MLTETASLVTVDKAIAQKALRDYRSARAPATDEDRAIMAAYRQIARGRVVVQAIESIRKAGRFEDSGLPKLAITRANVRRVHCWSEFNRVEFTAASDSGRSSYRARIEVARMPEQRNTENGVAMAPLIPLHLRPKHDLANYWILFEADWQRAPVDPLLLRRLKGDLWIVLAAWELTAVERAVLEQRAPQ